MSTLILWRHGTTDWNTEHRMQGHSDSPLNALGHQQAAQVAPVLAARKPVAIVSSDLSRAADTALPLAQLTGLPVRRDPRLRERSYGDWEGLTSTEVAERFPEARARQRAGEHDLGHGIESPADVMKRAGEALREAADAANGGTVVIATHGGTARYGMFELLGWPVDLLGTVLLLDNCHYTELRWDAARGWRLQTHNAIGVRSQSGYE